MAFIVEHMLLQMQLLFITVTPYMLGNRTLTSWYMFVNHPQFTCYFSVGIFQSELVHLA